MATWHQQQARGVKLYHDTLWVVHTDPPNKCASSTLFETEAQAKAFLPLAGPHSYILRPAKESK